MQPTFQARRDSRCVAWSGDGRELSYITGELTRYADTPALAIQGTLWSVSRFEPTSPRAIATGFFPTSECPAWSARTSLAFVVRTTLTRSQWVLRVYQNGDSATIAPLVADVPALRYRSFDWAPNRNALVFANNDELSMWDSGEYGRLGDPNSLRLLVESTPRPDLAAVPHSVRFSPSGRFVAVSQRLLTAVCSGPPGLAFASSAGRSTAGPGQAA